mmetsp:Transcript_52527/g.122929  ORF Transcript_52527/g.122929 Transcript_52527/m.122929 type:complete len:207 (-) Transcript_52527:7-627(-)
MRLHANRCVSEDHPRLRCHVYSREGCLVHLQSETKEGLALKQHGADPVHQNMRTGLKASLKSSIKVQILKAKHLQGTAALGTYAQALTKTFNLLRDGQLCQTSKHWIQWLFHFCYLRCVLHTIFSTESLCVVCPSQHCRANTRLLSPVLLCAKRSLELLSADDAILVPIKGIKELVQWSVLRSNAVKKRSSLNHDDRCIFQAMETI